MPIFLLIIFALLFSCCNRTGENGFDPHTGTVIRVKAWITDPGHGVLFTRHDGVLEFSSATNTDPVIVVDTTITYQVIDGFGNCLTGGSAIHLNSMSPSARSSLLHELFDTSGNNIGISYLRVSIGASDLSDRVFSYNDLSEGETDPEMERFTIDQEKKDVGL